MSTQTSRLSPEKVWLGITPTLWWNDDFINIDIGIPFEQCISEMALAGYVGCSVGHKYPTDPKTLKAALDLRGLRISEPWVSTYFTIRAMKEQTIRKVRQQLAFLKEMEGSGDDPRKADLVVAEFGDAVNPLPIALFPNCPKLTDAQWDQLVDGLHEIGRIARAEGRRLCYHPHLGTGVMTAEAIDRLMERTDADLVHLLLDTGHLAAAGADPLTVAKKYASRVKHIHLKDIRADVVARIHADGLSFEAAIEAGIFTVPGDGSIRTFPQILAALAEAGFAGWLVIEAEQDPAKANPLQYAKMARAYLRETLGW
ncbi:myo-inosose-2 dehydratase [Pararhizobium sp. A13]|uniref:myo-inosose-2 dehydratase n=1 Tax=Pararhizobium sp. A13 TaxID=3133975 RepID=UPI00311B40A6